jgi:hypothetical protein
MVMDRGTSGDNDQNWLQGSDDFGFSGAETAVASALGQDGADNTYDGLLEYWANTDEDSPVDDIVRGVWR